MTYDEAITRRDELNARDAGGTRTWRETQRADGTWDVKVSLDPTATRDPLIATTEQKPETPEPSDPRSIVERQIGGNYAGG